MIILGVLLFSIWLLSKLNFCECGSDLIGHGDYICEKHRDSLTKGEEK